jgi:hypothetical protein
VAVDPGVAQEGTPRSAETIGVPHAAAVALRWTPVGLIALAAFTALWTRLIGLDQSMWNDEVYSVVHYITPGPSAIFSSSGYVPNDHVLFELLTWATVHISGGHANATYRLWSVVPSLAALVVMAWWLLRRYGEWVAAVFAVLAVAAPVHLIYATQARGYGLSFLAGAVLVIGAVTFKEERSRRGLALIVAGSLVGIWTLPVFVLFVLAVLLPLLWFRALRRPLMITLVGLGAASLLFYAPLLSAIIHQSNQQFGTQLGWDGFVHGPLHDQLLPTMQLLLPNAPRNTLGAIIAAILVAGLIGLWRRRDWVVAVVFLGSAILTYLGLEIGRFYVSPRFASFVLLPMLAVAAVGLVEVGLLLARGIPATAVVVLACVTLSILLLSKIEKVASTDAQTPIENFQQAAAVISRTNVNEPIVTNSEGPIELRYYLGGSRGYQVMSPPALAKMFCSTRTPFIFVQDDRQAPAELPPITDTTCLVKRGAVSVGIPQQWGATLAVWFVPALPATVSRSANAH